MQLRPPTEAERAAGLPKTKSEAIKRGLTRFIGDDGVERIIRNYGSKSKPVGRVTPAPSRKTSLQSNSSRRNDNLNISTPPKSRTKANYLAANAKMAAARTDGLVGDHITDVARSGNGLRSLGDTLRQELYFDRFKKAGVPLGHTPENIKPVTARINGEVKIRQTAAMDAGIKKLKGLPSLLDVLTGKTNSRSFLAQSLSKGANGMKLGGNLLLEYGTAFIEIGDHYTDGAVSNGINNGAQTIKNGFSNGAKYIGNEIANGVNKIVDAYASTKPNNVDLTGN